MDKIYNKKYFQNGHIYDDPSYFLRSKIDEKYNKEKSASSISSYWKDIYPVPLYYAHVCKDLIYFDI